jgi:hypothetical protein
MKRNTIYIGVALLVAVVVWYVATTGQPGTQQGTGPAGPQPTQVAVDLTIAARKLTPARIEARQDDIVTLRIVSDEVGEFHLAGYEILAALATDSATYVTFLAKLPGRYNIELHPRSAAGHKDIPLGTLVVSPK